MCSLNVWNNVPMNLKYVCQQYFTCFLGFIRYNKTFIACGFRKYEHLLFIHRRVSYSTLALPSGNMILLGEYICIFPSPVCNKCIITHWLTQYPIILKSFSYHFTWSGWKVLVLTLFVYMIDGKHSNIYYFKKLIRNIR